MLIKTKNNVPDIYTTESRDFQLFEVIFDLLCNADMSNSDKINYLRYTQKLDTKLLKLLCGYLGFFTEEYYPDELLRSVLINFPYIIKLKGTKSSIEEAMRALQNAFTNRSEVYVKESNDDPYRYVVETVGERINPIYFKDILRFIRPVGIIVEELYQATSGLSVSNKISTTDKIYNLYAESGGSQADTDYFFGRIRNKAESGARIEPTLPLATSIGDSYLSRINHTPITSTQSFMKKITITEDPNS